MPVLRAETVENAAALEAEAASLLIQVCPPMKACPLPVPC